MIHINYEPKPLKTKQENEIQENVVKRIELNYTSNH